MVNLITLLISGIAVLISVMAFIRDRDVELQNQVYLKKLEAYSEVIAEFFRLLKTLGDVRDEAAKLILTNKSFINDIRFNELGEKVDLEIIKIQQDIGLKSIFFKQDLIDEIIYYLESLYGQIDPKKSNDPISDLDTYIDLQTQELENLITKMRNELGLDEMNRKLLKRIKKGRIRTGL